ncbi:MAG: sodium-dependent transporter [Acidiferrobacterales bacterium]
MKTARSVHGLWSSSERFVLAASGFTISLNNIWQFPYHVVQYGGGAFISVYVIFMLLLGLPLFAAQLMLGRLTRLSPVNAMRDLIRRTRSSRAWLSLGMLIAVAGLLILSWYSVIAGWLLAYVVRSVAGLLGNLNTETAANEFSSFVSDPERQLFWHSLFMVMTLSVVAGGVRHGIEAVSRIVVPALLVLLAVLVVYAAIYGDIVHSVAFFVTPDFLKLSGRGVLTALGDAFFSLGLGAGAMMIYGAYLPGHTHIPRTALIVVLIDIAAAVMAGMVILPVLYAAGAMPTQGPALIFRALPVSFDVLPLGDLMQAVFFVFLALVAWMSSVALAEPAVTWLIESRHMSRLRASMVCGIGAWLLGIVTILSFGAWKFSFRFLGLTESFGMFDGLQILTSGFIMPVIGVLSAVFAAWVLSTAMTREALATRSRCTYDAWLWLTRLAVPAWLLIVAFNMRIFL